MKPGLIATHYSLLAIAIISSCCLFYLVASENAKNAETAKIRQNADGADVSIPLPPFNKIDTAAVKNVDSVKREILEKSGNAKVNKEKIYPNYKEKKSDRQKGAVSPSVSKYHPFFSKENSDVSLKIDLQIGSIISDAVDDNSVVLENVYDKNIAESDKGGYRDGNLESEICAGESNKAYYGTNMASKDDSSTCLQREGLPDIITDIPAVTVTELPLEVLQPMQSSLNAIIVESPDKKSSTADTENRTVDVLEGKNEQVQQGDQIIKINDSGGDVENIDSVNVIVTKLPPSFSTSDSLASQAQSDNGTTADATPTASVENQQVSDSAATIEGNGTVNLTNEEVPMPVFSEWAQKQMEAAEKQQQAKEQVVNTISQKKNLTNGSKKLPVLKMRAKNYASPDCGAKIIASNSDATNTGAVLSSSKDEYMLSPCGNRIWFVVELCEAIQAQKVDLANFELFSSSPKNFSVAVSNRFPTRDWSNVGRFVAEDKRNVQSFDLHPHLFGKFVRVDIHSHHSQEHFCPVSLFRVYGTSEIEAFETENHPDDELDDFDDDLYGGAATEQANVKNSDNIFKSASDAVLSIVKKAAEVLVKPSNNQNTTLKVQTKESGHQFCRSFIYGQYNCPQCTPTLVERINNVLSCEYRQLENLLTSQRLRSDLLNTQICSKRFNIDAKALNNDCSLYQIRPLEFNIKSSYYINLLPEEYIGALCFTLSSSSITGSEHASTLTNERDNEIALNLTIDKKFKTTEFKALEGVATEKKVIKQRKPSDKNISKTVSTGDAENVTGVTTETPPSEGITEINIIETEQIIRPPEAQIQEEPSTTTLPKEEDSSSPQPVIASDVNIYNVPSKSPEKEPDSNTKETSNNIKTNLDDKIEEPVTDVPPQTVTVESVPKSEEDPTINIAWDNLDTLLPTTISPGSNTGVNAPLNSAGGANLQQKISGGPQSESIFIRLSNRIKALERNMSLSGQYLEELSRRYKKQVEELQQILTQQSQTVRNLEEQNRRHIELQKFYEEGNVLLRNELDNMALQVHACIIVIIVVGAFVLLLLVVSILFFRAMWRRNKSTQLSVTTESKRDNNVSNQKKLSRRKSFEEYSDHGVEKARRPSEEVTDILKKHLEIPEKYQLDVHKAVQNQPQRKISVCYGSSPNQIGMNQEAASKSKISVKRKNAKSSWPNPNDTRQIALEHLENMRGMDVTLEEYKQILEKEKGQKDKSKSTTINGSGKTKKKTQNFKRQESAPAQCINNSTKKIGNVSQTNDYSENLILDEEDLDNFIPNSDLAYNEFMPEGPSGYQIIIDENESTLDGSQHGMVNEKSGKKKLRRISSPGFFKTSISKALKGKSLGSANGNTPIVSKTPHSSATSWEWHRLKNADLSKNSHLHSSPSSVGLLRGSPTGSLDASTLSEIHFPTNSTENSFRILEAAILSSGEIIDSSPTEVRSNGKQSHSATSSISGGSNSSQRSSISNSTSSSTKKKRGFNRIFRKVF